MKPRPIGIAVFAAVALAATPSLLAQTCGGSRGSQPASCCARGATARAGHASHASQAGHDSHGAPGTPALPSKASAPSHPALTEPVKLVFDNYLKVQSALAKDSLEGVSANASAMAKAIRADSTKRLAPQVADHADAVAKAKDLKAARAAFKPLSQSLIRYLADQKVPKGHYHQVYCPMAKASWLQTEAEVSNPYFGQSMLRCGELKS